MTSDQADYATATTVRLSNSQLTVDVAIDCGAEIRHVGRPGCPNALACYDWRSPDPVTRAYVGDTEFNWLAGYRGGWQETIPSAGSACTVADARLPFHGDASVRAWRVSTWSDTACSIEVALSLPILVRRTMTLAQDSPTLRVETTLTREAPVPVPYVWGHHPCFPAYDGTWVELPASSYVVEPAEAGDIATTSGTWPIATDTAGRTIDLSIALADAIMRCVYLRGHQKGRAVLHQPTGQPSVELTWDIDAYPVTWLWQIRDEPGFPWFGRMRAHRDRTTDCVALRPPRRCHRPRAVSLVGTTCHDNELVHTRPGQRKHVPRDRRVWTGDR